MRRRSLLAATAATAVTLWTGDPLHANTPTRRRFYGLHDGTGTAWDHIRYGSLRLHDAGVAWKDVETTPDVYDFTRLDALVTAATAHDVEPTLVLGYTPAWIGDPNTPPDPTVFATYATAVLARYKGRIRTYSPWNEVNDPQFWGGTPTQMTALCQVLSDVRATVDPGARLLSPSFQTSIRYQRSQLEHFLARSWRLFDAVGVSLYPPYGTGPEEMADLARKCRARMAMAGCPNDMPLWGTEVNYDVRGGTTATLLPRWTQAAMVVRSYMLAACAGVARLHWYRWDWGLVDGAPLANTLLTNPTDPNSPTVAGEAIDTARRWLSGGHPRLHVEPDGTHRVVVTTPRVRKVTVWNPEKRTHIEAPMGAFRLHRINGTGRRIGKRRVRVGVRPKMIEVAV